MNDSKLPAILIILAIVIGPAFFQTSGKQNKGQQETQPVEELDQLGQAARDAAAAWLIAMAENCDEFSTKEFSTLDDQYNALADENESDRGKAFQAVNAAFDRAATVEDRKKLFPKAGAGYRAAAEMITRE